MNSTTLCLFINWLHRALISSSVRGRAGAAGEALELEVVGAGACGVAVDVD